LNPIPALVPLVFLLTMTSWALLKNLQTFVKDGDWILAPLDAAIFGLAIWLIIEAVLAFRRVQRGNLAPVTPEDARV